MRSQAEPGNEKEFSLLPFFRVFRVILWLPRFLVPKLCLGTHFWKLRFLRLREAELPSVAFPSRAWERGTSFLRDIREDRNATSAWTPYNQGIQRRLFKGLRAGSEPVAD